MFSASASQLCLQLLHFASPPCFPSQGSLLGCLCLLASSGFHLMATLGKKQSGRWKQTEKNWGCMGWSMPRALQDWAGSLLPAVPRLQPCWFPWTTSSTLCRQLLYTLVLHPLNYTVWANRGFPLGPRLRQEVRTSCKDLMMGHTGVIGHGENEANG